MALTKYRLQDIAEVVGGGTPSTLVEENYGGEIVWITPKDLSNQNSKFIEQGERSISDKGFNSCSAQMIPAYNILMSSRAPIGLLAINKVECCTNQGFKSLILNKSICDVDYIYYYLKHHFQEIEGLGTGTTFKEVSKGSLLHLGISIPPLEEQQIKARLLSCIDAKIALNRSINHNLEAMAKQLYDYWFLQFNFPDENGKPYKSSGGKMVWNEKLKREIPEGWRIDAIGNILDKYPTTKRYETKEYLKEGRNPIVDQGDAYIVGFTNEDDNLLTRIPAVLFGDHSTKVKLLDFVFARGADGTQILYSNNPNVSQYYLYMVISSLQIPNPGYSRHFKYLKELPIIIPESNIVNAFTEVISPLFKQRKENIFSNITLIKQRDELLPLLMNGQASPQNCD